MEFLGHAALHRAVLDGCCWSFAHRQGGRYTGVGAVIGASWASQLSTPR
jgi:hypothetical protein